MRIAAVDKAALNQYGLPELPFIVTDPENTRYVMGSAQFAYITENEDIVGFIVFRKEKNQIFIYYVMFNDEVSISEAEEFLKELCSKKEVFALTYDCNIASEVFRRMGLYSEPGLQYMELTHFPHFRETYGMNFVRISPSKIPTRMTRLYNTCFSVADGKQTLEEFILDPFSKTGSAFILRMKRQSVGFWIDVTYFENLCFNCWIGIIPQRRRKGYGTQLMEHALALAQRSGCTRAGLLVNPKNEAAVQFYHRIGFRKKWGRIHFQSEPE